MVMVRFIVVVGLIWGLLLLCDLQCYLFISLHVFTMADQGKIHLTHLYQQLSGVLSLDDSYEQSV